MTTKPDRIIVADDDPELRSLLKRFLSEHGFDVRAVEGGAALDRELSRKPADLVVLDLMMPGEDGLAICRRLRAAGDMLPIVMLTARGDPIDKIIGLESGVDDYLAKPFEPRELVARIASVLRRSRAGSGPNQDETMALGPLALNFTARVVTMDGNPISLSSREFSVLQALAHSHGRPLSRAQLVERAFGRDAEVTDRAIDVQVARLRKAIGDGKEGREFVKTVWGVGYVLVSSDDA